MIYPEHTYIITWDLDRNTYYFSSFQVQMFRLNEQLKTTDFRQSLLHPDVGLMQAGEMFASISNWKHAKKGDRFFMYMISEKEEFKNRIVASGFFYNDPYFDGRWTIPKNVNDYTVDLDLDVMLNPCEVYDLLTEEVLELQFPDYDWSGKTSDFVLDDKTAYMLEWKWYFYLRSLNLKCEGEKFWCRCKDGIEDMYQWRDYRGDGYSYDMGRAALYMPYLLRKIRPKENIEAVRQRIKEKLKQQQESEQG